MKQVTRTRVETTLYDTNGKKISVRIKKTTEEIEIYPKIIPVGRKKAKEKREEILLFKNKVKEGLKMRDKFIQIKGQLKGGEAFMDVADAIIILHKVQE